MEIQLKKKTIKENELTMQVLKTKKMNVAAYARVSTDLDNQRISLDSQKKYYNSKIIENPNWNLVGVYLYYFVYYILVVMKYINYLLKVEVEKLLMC